MTADQKTTLAGFAKQLADPSFSLFKGPLNFQSGKQFLADGKVATDDQIWYEPELLEGVRQYALKEFGPLVITVFESWGIRACEDIGRMVFNLIDAGVFGKTEEDSMEDFKSVYDFQEAFVKPFAPTKMTPAKPPPGLPAPTRTGDK